MGTPKAWLPFGDEFMLPRVVRILRSVVDPVVVVAAVGQDVPPLPPDVHIVRDEIEGKGPLAGLAAGLSVLEGVADAVYLSACDVPFLKPEFVRRLFSFLASGGREPPAPLEQGAHAPRSPSIALPLVGGYHHPLAAVYRPALLPLVRELLATDRLRMTDLFDAAPTRVIAPHELADVDPEFTSLRNLNTPEEYIAALQPFVTG